mgnify:CR=1 FL=1
MKTVTSVHPFRQFARRNRETESFPQFENNARETVRELSEREPVVEIPEEFMPVFLNEPRNHSPEVRAPKGVALRKSVLFRTHRGEYMSAKVVGWENDGALILSRKNGPPFCRRLPAT